ncbi:hypothetical protein DFH07DRAFT_824530 [Mycena maculata]|uniref:F-box domain-containing protein n=1 Tax=Mycena maculata TaxID=230809 RepID=A0AAD7J034_9AGAR|nr:hypothetical protein DFH07DRAFT_824530 [Mycena maculata]
MRQTIIYPNVDSNSTQFHSILCPSIERALRLKSSALVAFMSRALAECRANLSRIRAEISRLERSLGPLRIAEKVIQEQLQSYRYPVMTLPNEITAEIFTQFLPPYPLCPPATGPSSPTLFTHVCRKWRDVALTTPSLWRAIKVSFWDDRWRRFEGGPGVLNLEQKINLVKSWLSRSGSCPLSIQMDVTRFIIPPHEFLAELYLHRTRWEYVDFVLPRVYNTFLRGPMPSLRALNLDIRGHEAVGTTGTGLTTRDVPRLRAVTLVSLFAIDLPWAQLTSLTLRAGSPDWFDILAQCVNLIECELAFFFVPSQVPGIKLGSLESLTLRRLYQHGMMPRPSLDIFTLPALRALQVPDACLGFEPIPTLASFISRSGCDLEEVRIDGVEVERRSLYRQSFPAVPVLRFCSGNQDDTWDNSSTNPAEG